MIRMADNRGRDSYNLWSEMPPSRKNRPSQPAKPAEQTEKNKRSKGKNLSNIKNKLTNKQDKKKKAENKKSENKPAVKNTAYKNNFRTPSYLQDDGIAKPIDIQSRVLKNKTKNRRQNAEGTAPKSLGKRLTRHFSRYVLFYSIGIILVIIVSVALSRTVLFNITKIEVIGETVYSDQEVIDKCGVALGTNLNFISEVEIIERLIDELPYVDKITVTKDYFKSHLKINLVQAKAIANIETKDGGYYLISANGRILDSTLTSPNTNCIVVAGFNPEFAVSGAFLSVADEGTRNYLTKLLKSVKIYSGIDKETEIGADLKLDTLFEVIDAYNVVGMTDKIKGIDITSIYSICLNYDNKLILNLGENVDVKVKLTIAKNLIDKGEFENEKGELDLSKAADPASNMKVTFRPIYSGDLPIVGGNVNPGGTSKPDDTSKPMPLFVPH